MIEPAFFAFLGALCLFAIRDWEKGFYFVIIVAFLQDPVRKMVDGQPAYFILMTGVVFGATLFGAALSRVPLNPAAILGWRHHVGVVFTLYVLVICLQAVNSFVRFENAAVPTLGAIGYLAPFVSLVLCHQIAAYGGVRRVRGILWFYFVLSCAGLFTVYLERSGFSLPIFGEVGDGLLIFDKYLGVIVRANSGAFRASEVAAWHGGMAASVIVLLLTERRPSLFKFFVAIALAGVIIAVSMMTGRRKLVVMFLVFLCCYGGLVVWFQSHLRAPAFLALLAAFAVFIFGESTSSLNPEAVNIQNNLEYSVYVSRTSSVFGDLPERVVALGIAPVSWAYEWYGLFGGGVGVGTQGVQFLIETDQSMGAAEGGLGKIMLELGAPGLLLVLALGVAFTRFVLAVIKFVSSCGLQYQRLTCGLVSLLIANLASFSVATQVYGDIFILLFLGFIFGSVLAMPRIIHRESLADRQQADGLARDRKPPPRAGRNVSGLVNNFDPAAGAIRRVAER